ncbi:putative Thioredoxin-like protein 1 [Seiridium unicorne]|uniref:Thioredoxin-like protein 1 n=1 Tax=Seiridium unicorne TaxID=138068 RepID=A0ABR2UTL2_9PEZI
MSKTVEIQTPEQFSEILGKSRIVVADSPTTSTNTRLNEYQADKSSVYANWCGPCKQIAPFYEQLSQSLSRPNIATFTKVNTEGDRAKEVAQAYAVTSLPTFIIFRDGKVVDKVKGADPARLKSILEKLGNEIETAGEAGGSSSGTSGTGGMTWIGADLPRGYSDISDIIDIRGLELLNADSEFSVRTLFNKPKPAALGKSSPEAKDWVESDTDEQLLLFIPLNSAVKLHTIQITSVPPEAGDDEDEDEIPMRPKTIKLFTNRPHNLGFDEADDIPPTQEIEINEGDWNANGTANISLRFVRFQNITSLVLFVVDGDGDSEKVRLDRVRLIGESGEKREMGKLEKIGDDPGE